MIASSSLQNLDVDVQGRTEGVKPGGDSLDRVITIRNQGDRLAELEVWLEPTDGRAEPLRQWGVFDKADDALTLKPQEAVDVVLSFMVPLKAEPGFYAYDIRVRSPQYVGEEIRRSQQLQVLASEQDALHTEPHITVLPETDSTHAHRLKSGVSMELAVAIENPSRRTDRFFLACPDLPASWFTITYPEKPSDGSALVEQTDGLLLNPKEQGQIQLRIHPPLHAPAGNYFPTIRITSSNRSDLVILEIIYITIPVDDRLLAELTPDSRKIPAKEDTFTLHLTNPGNIDRELVIAAGDPERTFVYRIQPDTLMLTPGATADAILYPRPRQWWRQAWRLREQTITFDVDIQNIVAKETPPRPYTQPPTPTSPIDPATLPALPANVPHGEIIWKVKRRWLFYLLLALTGLGLLTTAALVFWYFFIWRPSLRPNIAAFATAEAAYSEGEDATVTFDWQVTNVEQIGKLRVIYPVPAASALSDDESNDLEVASSGRSNVDAPDEAFKDYFFANIPVAPNADAAIPTELQAFCKQEDTPAVDSFGGALLRVSRRLMRRPENIQTLACTGVPLEAFPVQAGSYDFQLLVFPARDDEVSSSVSDREKVVDVAIAPPPPPAPPAISEFTATSTEYRLLPPDTASVFVPSTSDPSVEPTSSDSEVGSETDANAAANTAPVTSLASAVPATDSERPFAPIRLNWTISNLRDIQFLTLVSLAPDGSEHELPQTFEFTSEVSANAPDINRVPFTLRPFCTVEANTLTCEQVPTSATEVGEYVFYLTVTTQSDHAQDDAAEIVESTATIPIKPPAPEIISFALNGEEGAQRPKHVFTVNPARGSLDVTLTWEVEHASEVELMPAPGMVEGSSLTYTISAAPGSETITLRAVNDLDEEVTRSIVIEKVGFNPDQPVSPAASNAEAGGVLPPPPQTVPVPTVPIPRSLPSAEEPPQAN